jgi:hypothetical protein
MSATARSPQQGQVLALFALALTALVLGTAVVVDGGFAFAQRREAQNAADFAAMAGTRIVGMAKIGKAAGTAANAAAAVTTTLAANDAQLVSARYVDTAGQVLGEVMGASTIPPSAFGVVVEARKDWQPYLLGIIGISDWIATAEATAMTSGDSIGGGVLPVGIQATTYDGLAKCSLSDFSGCVSNLTSGQLNIPGGFGWLSFGLQGNGGKCDWTSSLGMFADGGCQMNQPYLDSQIGPPADSHGCCTAVGEDGSEDKISTLTGNEWGDLSFYIDNQIPVWLPIWSTAGGQGSNAYYDIVGFGAVIFTDEGDGKNPHAKWLKGAAVENACLRAEEVDGETVWRDYTVPGTHYCDRPLGAFNVAATGAVRLMR